MCFVEVNIHVAAYADLKASGIHCVPAQTAAYIIFVASLCLAKDSRKHEMLLIIAIQPKPQKQNLLDAVYYV